MGLESVRTARPADPYLTPFAISLRNANEQGAVADILAPEVPVKGDTGIYTIWSSGNVMRSRNTQWAKGAPTPELRIRATSDTFACKKYGLKTSIDDDDRDNNLSGPALDEEATAALVKTLQLDKEIRIYTAISALTADLDLSSGTNTQWDEASAVPKKDLDSAVEAIQKALGVLPTHLVMGRSIRKSLRTDTAIAGSAAAQLLAAVQYSLPATLGNINDDLIAQFLDVPVLAVSQVVYDAAIETTTVDTANVTGTYVWPDDMVLFRSEATPTTTSLAFMKTFASDRMHITPRWRDEDRESDFLRVRMKVDEKVVARKAAYYFKNVLNLV